MAAIEDIYQKKTQLEHILLRPDTYIGSAQVTTIPMWVWEDETMVHRPCTFTPGLYKIFDEILVNAADNKIRDPSMNTIKVTINAKENVISVYNNGAGVPIQMHQKEKVYVPELIFGHLLTSSNFNDDQKKVTGGRNGLGAKLCVIFSTYFNVETCDGEQMYRQTFTNNLSQKSEPKITAKKGSSYTKITFRPDLEKFGMTEFTSDLEALFNRRVYDLTGTVNGVKVFLNEKRIDVKSFKQYCGLYLKGQESVHEVINDRWEILVAPSDQGFTQTSFVNSINTYKGGTHVNYIADQIVHRVLEAVKKKNKAAPVKPAHVKQHLWIFINCLIENPTFDSQTKENMTLPRSSFGSNATISDNFLKKLSKLDIVDRVLSWAKGKSTQLLQKAEGSAAKNRITGIPKLDDANWAGTKNSSSCTLILTEGDSAKALAVSGLSVIGRDKFGVFPLRGKLLNVREASHQQIIGNVEISAIKKIMGLQTGKTYTTTEGMRYGHLMIMTDQDHDGSHIKGLIINMLDHFFPSLLKIPGFLVEFITPIVKCTKGKTINTFFTLPEYEAWLESNNEGKGHEIKYYKGLGTSTAAEAKVYFSDLARHRKVFRVCEEPDRQLIDMAFNKKKADTRKEWLANFKPGTHLDHSAAEISMEDFINKELILFSMADNERSIPSAMDGLKPGQRKILFACFKRKLKNEMKVAQLSGYVAEHSAYHHGEQSLVQTIVGMAQNFVGSNNIALLQPRGQFGTRIQGGKDAASGRYIFTCLDPMARILFPEEDDVLLKTQTDDGQPIEPLFYMPILPFVLVNGAEGIGTGWSTSIPSFHPRHLVKNIRRLMAGKETKPMLPYYHKFKGTIEEIEETKILITGCIEVTSKTTVRITELPIGTWTQSYKEFLESMIDPAEASKVPTQIKGYKEYHTDTTVDFVVTMDAEKLREAEKEGLAKKFKLITTQSFTNLVAFNHKGQITKYENEQDILEEFYSIRLRYYKKRKRYLEGHLQKELDRLENKTRFVSNVIAGKLRLLNRKKESLVSNLKEEDYLEIDGGFDYLLSMPLWSVTREKIVELLRQTEAKQKDLEEVQNTSPTDMWNKDLDAFLEAWDAMQEKPPDVKTKPVVKRKIVEHNNAEDKDDDVPLIKRLKVDSGKLKFE